VLAAALLGLLPVVQASNWGFTLTGKVTTENIETQEPHEVLQMTGAGKFNPEAGTASGGGAFAVFNGFDELDQLFGGPTFRGTWKVTDFVDWTPDGLEVLVTLFYKVGTNDENKGLKFEGVPVLITEDGIILDFFGLELFAANTTGSVEFHLNKP
jgi:hypothetical protein